MQLSKFEFLDFETFLKILIFFEMAVKVQNIS